MLKFGVGLLYVLTAGLSLTGVLPFTVLTSAVAVYGLAGEMVKFAEGHSESECWGGAYYPLPAPAV